MATVNNVVLLFLAEQPLKEGDGVVGIGVGGLGVIGIAPVRLNGHRKDKIRTLRAVQTVADLGDQNFVLCPAEGIVFHAVHVFQRGKGVKSQCGVHLMTVVEGSGVVVDGVRGVADVNASEKLWNVEMPESVK